MATNFRAPSGKRQVKENHAYRDTRRISEVIYDEISNYDMAIVAVVCLVLVPFYNPLFAYASLPLIFIVYAMASLSDKNRTLPVKLPFTLGKQLDKNHTKPGQSHKFEFASGTIMLGNLRTDKSEVWITGKDLLTHVLLIGTTGAGKTETLVSLSACSSFSMGGGTIYVDAKAAPKLIFQFATLARIFGREDDIRVINYITGDRVVKERDWERLSNTTNPFAQGTANTAEQTLIGLLPSGGGDNQYFLDRAIAILRALLPALVELRDKGVLNIYPSLIGEYISISKFMELSRNIIVINGVAYDKVTLSDKVLNILKTFLKQLPGYVEGQPVEKQPEEVAKQFGFAEGYFARTLASLAGTYGHIYETELAEADFVDIVMHNRILIVLVPAMEQSSEERAALGKIVLSSIRSAMAQGLGGKGEGDYEDVIESLPIDLRIPTIIIVDEYAEVAVPGFAVTATQGRGLGMSVVFAGQDLAGFVRADEAEADMIFGNTRLKILMALEDPEITWRKFRELAGTMKVAESAGWEQDSGGLNTYQTNFSTSIRDVERINILDLKEQTEGQGHLFERSNIHKVQLFHHGISDKKLVKNFRVNRMLKIKKPEPHIVELLQKNIDRNNEIEFKLNSNKPFLISGIEDDVISTFASKNKELIKNNKDWPLYLLEVKSSSTKNKVAEETITNTGKEALDGSLKSLPQANVSVDKEATTSEEQELTNPTPIGSNNEDLDGLDVASFMGDMGNQQTIQQENEEESPANLNELSGNSLDTEIDRVLSHSSNHWIYNNIVDKDGIAKVNSLYSEMVDINTSSGLSEVRAKKSACQTIDNITVALDYPSQIIVSIEDEDTESLWDCLDDLSSIEDK